MKYETIKARMITRKSSIFFAVLLLRSLYAKAYWPNTSPVDLYARTPKVAVIFNGDDSDPESRLAKAFSNTQDRASKLYKQAGFDKVIILSANSDQSKQATADALVKELKKLKGVTDLHIQFIGHGNSYPLPKTFQENVMGGGMLTGQPSDEQQEQLKKDKIAYERRFMPVPINQKESQIFSEVTKRPDVYDQSIFSFATVQKTNQKQSPNVGLGDLNEAIDYLKSKNPTIKVTLYTGACYSGNVARFFANKSGVQTFTSSQVALYSWNLAVGEKKDSSYSSYDGFFQKYLLDGNTYLEAHDKAMADFFEMAKDGTSVYNRNLSELTSTAVPRSGLYEFVLNWCLSNPNPLAPKTSCRNQEWTTPLDQDFKKIDEYYAAHHDMIQCNQHAEKIAKIEAIKKDMLAKAIEFTENKIPKNPDFEKIFKMRVENLENALKKNPDDPLAKYSLESIKKNLALLPQKKQEFFQDTLKQLKNEIYNTKQQCLLDQKVNSGFYYPDCSPKEVSRKLLEILKFLGVYDPANSNPELNKAYESCIDIKNEKDNSQAALEQINCLRNQSKANPILAYNFSRFVEFGSACRSYKLVLDSVQDDKDCKQKFEKFADCRDWDRLKELYEMGSQRLIKKDGKTEMPRAQQGERVK